MRISGKPPKDYATNCQQERKNQQFGSGHPLRTTFTVIPGQNERNEEPNEHDQGNSSTHTVRPAELLRDNVYALKQRKGRRNIGHGPLH